MKALDVQKVLQEISGRLSVHGKCKILSQGGDCTCAKCQIDRMDPEEVLHAIKRKYA